MHALSMIDMGMQTSDAVVPAKTISKDEPQFGKVLNDKQQAQQPHESKPVERQPGTAESSSDKPVVARNHKTEMKQEATGKEELSNEIVVEKRIQATDEVNPQQQVKVQHTLIDLLKVMTQGESTEIGESFDSIKTLLTDLVQQLESTELHGEQVLAGVDLSVLVTELQSLNEGSDNEDLLAQLVTQVEEQLTDETGLLTNVELVAAIVAEPQQQNVASENVTPVTVKNLAQARQILQQAIDSVVPQKQAVAETVVAVENIATAEPPVEEVIFSMEEVTEEIDPRFAGLLKPRTENRSGQQAQSIKGPIQLHNSRQQVGLNQSDPAVPVLQEEVVEQKQSTEVSQRPDGSAKQMLENLTQLGQRNLQSPGQPPVQGLEMNRVAAPNPVVQLASGQQVAESHIFDQVVTQLSGSINGESGRMVLRLQPAELGSLKIELMVEGDRIRVNLHAQSQQVQEVLERNLPQLRNALAEQGLKIDQFQVITDKNHDQQNQFENLAQQQQNNSSEKQPDWHKDLEPEEQIIPLAHLMQNGGGGISLHV
ncbi:MAG: flagellar hook-length control protein FliK [Desulfuromusa sp.]|nr:flagellar hook-length control protein FliK [Desulfuromusa sp.]